MSLIDHYPFTIITALDMFANAVFRGRLGETISARLGRWLFGRKTGGWFAEATIGKLAALLDWVQHDHLLKAIHGTRDRAASLVALEDEVLAKVKS